MKKELNRLIKHHGSKKAVADLLGITVRHLEQNCLKEKHIGKSLEKLIRSYSVQFGE
jgi:DNA-binding transcriptional regulator YdaS (Cro superfamily)